MFLLDEVQFIGFAYCFGKNVILDNFQSLSFVTSSYFLKILQYCSFLITKQINLIFTINELKYAELITNNQIFMDQKWGDYKSKGEYGLSWKQKYNIPRPQPTIHTEDLGKTSMTIGNQNSQNSVLRSEDILASFGNSSINLFIKSKINERKDGQDSVPLDLDQTRKKQSISKSSTFLQELQRKYLPNRKPKHKDALRFLQTLISVLRIHIHKQQRQVFLRLQDNKKQFNRAAQFLEYEKEMRKRLNITKPQSVKLVQMQLSDVKPIGDYFEYESQSYVHNATKIDALAEPNLQVQISEVERPSLKDYEERDLQIQSATKSQLTHQNLSGLSEQKNEAFKFKPKVQKKIMQRKKSEGFSGIMGIQSFDETSRPKTEQKQRQVQYKLPKWLNIRVDEEPLSESNPFMEKFEVNKEIYHLNPDTFKDSTNDFHQPVMPEDKDGQMYASSEFNFIKGASSTQNCSPNQVVRQTQVTSSPNLTPTSIQKKYSFVNPYMKNIDSDSNQLGTINDPISDEGIYENFVPEEVNKNDERGYEASNSFRISDQNSVESQRQKRQTYTQKNLPKLNDQYFTSEKKIEIQKTGDRSIQYRINPQDRAYIRPKSNTVGMKNVSAVSVSPKKIQQSDKVQDPWKKKLQNKIKQNIRQQYENRPISKYPENFGEYLEMKQQNQNHVQTTKISQQSINYGSVLRSQHFQRPQSKITFQQKQQQSSKFTNYPPIQNVQQFNKPSRAISSGHFTYHNIIQNPPSTLQKNVPIDPRLQNNQYYLNSQQYPERRTPIREFYNQYGSNRLMHVSPPPPNKNFPSAYFTQKTNNFSEIRNNNINQRVSPIHQNNQNNRLPIQYGVTSPRNQKIIMPSGPTAQIYFHGNRSPYEKQQYRSPPPHAPSNPPSELKITGQESSCFYAQEGSKTPSRGNKKIHIFSALNRKEQK